MYVRTCTYVCTYIHTYTTSACTRGARACTTVISIRRTPVCATHTVYTYSYICARAPPHKSINACRPPPGVLCCLHAPLKPYSSVSLSQRNSTSPLRYFLVHPCYESLGECVNWRGSSLPCPKVLASFKANPAEVIRLFSVSVRSIKGLGCLTR